MTILKTLFLMMLIQASFSQDLLNERIRKVPSKKNSIYFNKGVFHTMGKSIPSTLKSARHGANNDRNYERLVFDFDTKTPPKVYGYKSLKENKIYVDFFKTTLAKNISSFGTSKLVEKIDFYPVGDETLSIELKLSGKHSIDVFILSNPGRLVIDIKK